MLTIADYESGGQEFESLRARQQFQYVRLTNTVLERSCLERRFQVRIRSERSCAGACLYARCLARFAAGAEMPMRSDLPVFRRPLYSEPKHIQNGKRT